ncbi:MAG: hypothetical protein M1132_13050 [Chloroflexi bacterium]|nr:hypothetical protein [Chloroflexota bacterium]
MESGPNTQRRYESLHRQALAAPPAVAGQGLELGFIERQGLAAWLAGGPEAPTVSGDAPTDVPAAA